MTSAHAQDHPGVTGGAPARECKRGERVCGDVWITWSWYAPEQALSDSVGAARTSAWRALRLNTYLWIWWCAHAHTVYAHLWQAWYESEKWCAPGESVCRYTLCS